MYSVPQFQLLPSYAERQRVHEESASRAYGKSYTGLSIAHGDDASLNYFKMVTGAFSNQETLQARKDLEEYCSLDTQGKICIIEELCKLCRS